MGNTNTCDCVAHLFSTTTSSTDNEEKQHLLGTTTKVERWDGVKYKKVDHSRGGNNEYEYDVNFIPKGPLGMRIGTDASNKDGRSIVTHFLKNGEGGVSLAEQSGKIQRGDIPIELNGKNIEGLSTKLWEEHQAQFEPQKKKFEEYCETKTSSSSSSSCPAGDLASQARSLLQQRKDRLTDLINLTKQIDTSNEPIKKLTADIQRTETDIENTTTEKAAAVTASDYDKAGKCKAKLAEYEAELARQSAELLEKSAEVAAKSAEPLVQLEVLEKRCEKQKGPELLEAQSLYALIEQALVEMKFEEIELVKQEEFALAGEKKKEVTKLVQMSYALMPIIHSNCPEDALPVQPGLNSLSKAVKEAKEKNIDCLFLENGVHDEEGEEVVIDFALNVVGQNKDDVKIRAGLVIKGKKEEDVFFTDLTVTGAKENGVYGMQGASMHLRNVCVEKCGGSGVFVWSTKRNTMTDCNVNNNKLSGVQMHIVCIIDIYVYEGRLIIDGSETTIHHNVTGGDSDSYGLETSYNSSIHLKSLTKESISTNNGGGGNYNGDGEYDGTIKTI